MSKTPTRQSGLPVRSTPTGWRVVRLGDIAELATDHWKVGDNELPYIGLEHVKENELRLKSVGDSNFVKSNKYRFRAGDTLFGKLRPYFRKVVRPDFDGICSTDIWVVRPRGDNDAGFIFYLFANQQFVDLCASSAEGTRMPRASWNFLSESTWKIPPLPEQKAIAEVLSSLDDKIDLLHRQNKTLEDMAQTLFRQWFVEEADEGWESVKLRDVFTTKGGTTPSTKEDKYWNGDINWATPKDLSNHRSVFLSDTERKITSKGLSKVSSGLLPVGTVLLSSRAPIGYLAITDIPLAINQGYIAILCNKILSNYFVYLWCTHKMEIIKNSGNGSVFQEISKSIFRNLDIIIPPRKILMVFDQIITPFFQKIKSNQYQIRTLENLRDTLLPKLMSGTAKIKDFQL